MWSIPPTEYYVARKGTKYWMNPENVMLSERRQPQKATYCRSPFMGNIQNRQSHRTESGLVVGRNREEVGMESEYGVSF